MGIIDFHTHIVSPWVIEHRDELSHADACFGTLYSDPRASLATADDLLRSMDEAEVSASVALNIGWSTHELCVRTNDYLLDAGTRWPGRIVPFCMVQPSDQDAAVIELQRCARAGARGIGELRPDAQGYSLLDTELLAPLAEAAATHKTIMLTHVSEPVGHRYPGKGTITPEQPYAFAKAFPRVVMVCAHWGGGLPFFTLMPEVGDALSNVYYDSAATQYLYRKDVFQTVADLAGVEHVLFGSDYPLIGQRRALDHARSAGMDASRLSAILGGNAARVLAEEARDG